jgi:hypothetical protein
MVAVHMVRPGQDMEGAMPAHRRSLARFGGVLLASVVLVGCNGAAAPSGAATKSGAPAKAAPSIDTAAGIRYAKATIAALTKDPFVAHVEQLTSATQEAGGKSAKILATMSADFAGDDMDVQIDATSIGQKLDMRMRLVGKNAYVYQSGTWLKGKRSKIKAEIKELVDAVRVFTDPNDLRYMGQERVGNKDLQHFRALRQLPYESGMGFAGHYDDFDLWVKSDGTPVRYEATFSVEDKKIGKVTGSMTVDFTKFGGPIKIKAPKTK